MAHDEPNALTAEADLPAAPVYADTTKEDHRHTYEKSGYYGVMFAPEYSWETKRCVEEAYGDSHHTPRSTGIRGQHRRSLRFHTDWLSVTEATECVTAIPEYNRFDPVEVEQALSAFPDTAKVVIGREQSPVLYVWTVAARTVMDTLDDIPLDGERDSEDVFAASGPDELGAVPDSRVSSYPLKVVGNYRETVSDGRPMLIRAWWD